MMTQEDYRQLNRKYQDEKIQRAENVRRYAEKLAPLVPWLNCGEYYWIEWVNEDTGHGDEFYTTSRWQAVCKFCEFLSWGHDYTAIKYDSPEKGTVNIFTNSDVPVLLPLPA